MLLTFGQSYAELQALFQAVFSGNWSTIAQNAAAPATNLYVSLHNAAPGDAGTQTSSETAYTNYARQAVIRTSAGWTCTLGSGTTFSNVTNAAAINFPACGATGDTLTHWGIAPPYPARACCCTGGPSVKRRTVIRSHRHSPAPVFSRPTVTRPRSTIACRYIRRRARNRCRPASRKARCISSAPHRADRHSRCRRPRQTARQSIRRRPVRASCIGNRH